MHPRPRIVVSACLGISPVRFDGGIIRDSFVELLARYVDLVPVCPEVGAGMGVPRRPVVLVRSGGQERLVEPRDGVDWTRGLLEFSTSFLRGVGEVDGFLLKASSPSCGVRDARVYDERGTPVGRGDGLFTRLVRALFPLLPLESEKRLINEGIRRLYLTRVFSIADARVSLGKGVTRRALVDFHRRYKYLLMVFSPSHLKRMGRLVATAPEGEAEATSSAYRALFLQALSRTPGRRSYANALRHAYGHLKRHMTEQERRYVLELIKGYETGRESLRTVVAYLKGFTYRFNARYLGEQRLLEPYPPELDPPEHAE